MSKNNFLLNRLFTRNILKRLLQLKKEKVYERIILEYNYDNFSKTNLEFFENIYKYMSENYRNEYFYQNTLFNKLLLGRHSLNTTTALTQIPIGSAKADFIMINGKAIIYEIKTELDSFERLENQIKNYYKKTLHKAEPFYKVVFVIVNSKLHSYSIFKIICHFF